MIEEMARVWTGAQLQKHRPESSQRDQHIHTVRWKRSNHASTRDATRTDRRHREQSPHQKRASHQSWAEDEDGDEEERVYLREAESVFSITSASERASAPRRCCRTARRERPANQIIASAQHHTPSSASITSRRCSGASCHRVSVSFSAAARDYQSNAAVLQLMTLDN